MLKVPSELSNFIKCNRVLILMVTLLFIAGVLLGALYSRGLVRYQLDELRSSLGLYMDSFAESPPLGGQVLTSAFINVFRFTLLVWVLGMAALGFPFALFFIVLEGFSLGFTIGLVVREMAFKGFLFVLASLLPQNLVIIPMQLIITVVAVNFSWFLFRSRFSNESKINYGYSFRNYSLLQLVLFLGLMTGAFVEAYITPVLIRLVLPYI